MSAVEIKGNGTLQVLTDDDPRLRRVAEEIPINPPGKVSAMYRALAYAMFQTMLKKGGIGIAAPQVGQPYRLIVIGDQDDDGNPIPITFINPTWAPLSDDKGRAREGCLSVPGRHGFVERHREIWCSAFNLAGDYCEFQASGLPAIVIQHECDHLDGILFTDRIREQGGLLSGVAPTPCP